MAVAQELADIDALESAMILLREGASDEKEIAFHTLQRMIDNKKKIVEDFEQQMETM
jgi:hypothetical protein